MKAIKSLRNLLLGTAIDAYAGSNQFEASGYWRPDYK